MAKWNRGLWHSVHWRPEDDLLAEFDKMEYHFVDDDYETGEEMFQRVLGVDGTASKKHSPPEPEDTEWNFELGHKVFMRGGD